MGFPENFLWGAATASYQIEGGSKADGKGESVWDSFCLKDEAIFNGDTGDIACDHYNRYREDIQLFKEIGLKGYRFSLSWPRIIPTGTGALNSAGVDFYDRLIDTLLEKEIDPCVTLFHWDYPQELYLRGGWLNRDSSDWFAEYAEKAVECFGDRVKRWITQNEPQCFIDLGHRTGYHAPGDQHGMRQVLIAAHNSMLGHGKAYRAMKAVRPDISVGYAPVGITGIPVDPIADRDAAYRFMFGHRGDSLFTNTWFMDPVFLGHYPEDGIKHYGKQMPEFPASDMEIINVGADFFGTNIYHGDLVKENGEPYGEQVPFAPGQELTAMGWQITPEALYWGPKFLHERYGKPIIITENGMAGTDLVGLDGTVNDTYRIEYLRRYLTQLKRGIEEGIPIEGYFAWSALDNFEWAEGYAKRFGIIHVDYATQKRTLKASAKWYFEVIKSNGMVL